MRCHFHHAGLQVLTCCALFFGTSVSLSAQGCESVFTHNLLPQGVIDIGIDPGGSPTFADQGIELVFDFFDPGGGPVYGSASSLDATPEFGFTRILALNDISAVYTLSQALPPGSTIQQVVVEFNDLNPNPEEIRINGAPPVFWNITDLMSAPNLPLAPGVEVQVDMMPGSSTVGKLILTGDLGEIKLGGTNLHLDDVCINPDGDPNGGGGGIPGCTYEVAINFDPNATIDNGSCQFDHQGVQSQIHCTANDTNAIAGAIARTIIDPNFLSSLPPQTTLSIQYSDQSQEVIPKVQTAQATQVLKTFSNPFGPYFFTVSATNPDTTITIAHHSNQCPNNYLSNYARNIIAQHAPQYSLLGSDTVKINPAPNSFEQHSIHLRWLDDQNATQDVSDLFSLTAFVNEGLNIPELDQTDTVPTFIDSVTIGNTVYNTSILSRPIEYVHFDTDSLGTTHVFPEPQNIHQVVAVRDNLKISKTAIQPDTQSFANNYPAFASMPINWAAVGAVLAGAALLYTIWDNETEQNCEEECGRTYEYACVGTREQKIVIINICTCSGIPKRTERRILESYECCEDGFNTCWACSPDCDDGGVEGTGGVDHPEDPYDKPLTGGQTYPTLNIIDLNPTCPCGDSEALQWTSTYDGGCPCELDEDINSNRAPAQSLDNIVALAPVNGPRTSDSVFFSMISDSELGRIFSINSAVPSGHTAYVSLGQSPNSLDGDHSSVRLETTHSANSLVALLRDQNNFGNRYQYYYSQLLSPELPPSPIPGWDTCTKQYLNSSDPTQPTETIIAPDECAAIFSQSSSNILFAMYAFQFLDNAQGSAIQLKTAAEEENAGIFAMNAQYRLDLRPASSPNQLWLHFTTPSINNTRAIQEPEIANQFDPNLAFILNESDTLILGEGSAYTMTESTSYFDGNKIHFYIEIIHSDSIHVLDIQHSSPSTLHGFGLETYESNNTALSNWTPYNSLVTDTTLSFESVVELCPNSLLSSSFQPGCTYPLATNYSSIASWDNGSCTFDMNPPSCITDLDGDGLTAVGDILLILGAFGNSCN